MNLKSSLKALALGIGVAALALVGAEQSAWAGTLHSNWNYSIDSFNDGTESWKTGQISKFEFYGIAMRETRQKVYFAVNSNLSLDGYQYDSALNGSIGYGDLFLNFADTSSVANANGNLHGIRFSDSNDSGYDTEGVKQNDIEVGVYSDVRGNGLMEQNAGYSDLAWHRDAVSNHTWHKGENGRWVKGGTASFGDLAIDTAYFNHDGGSTLNDSAYGYTNIYSGNRQGGVEMMDLTALKEIGLDFEHFGATGSNTFGFSVDRSLLSDGEFIAHLFAECDNDGIALAGSLDIPEPSAIVGLSIFSLIGAAYRRRQAKQ